VKGRAELVARIQQEFFSRNLLEPQSWVSKADELWEAAELLRPALEERWQKARSDPAWAHLGGNPPLGLNGVRLMLCAFAIENLCKASLVSSLSEAERQQVEHKGSLPSRLGSHNLPALARAAGFDVSAEEEAELLRLMEAAVAFGRYPLPKGAERLFAEEPPSQKARDANQLVDADLTIPSALFTRFRERFRK
jgi:hypothetical protein